MSALLTGLTWNSTIRDRIQVWVLAYLANCADDDGTNCFPSRKRIAKCVRCSERTVTRTLAELEKEGWLEVIERGDGAGNFTQFTIDVEKLKGSQDVSLSRPRTRKKGDKSDTKRVTPETKKGDIGDIPPHPLNGRPIIDPSVDTSLHEGKPSRSPKPVPDERFTLFRTDFEKAFQHVNHVPAPWDGKEAANLSRWLKANPTITREQWQTILRNRRASRDDYAMSLSAWISRALSWLNTSGGRNGNRNHETKSDIAVQNLREVLAERGLDPGSAHRDGNPAGRDAGEVLPELNGQRTLEGKR